MLDPTAPNVIENSPKAPPSSADAVAVTISKRRIAATTAVVEPLRKMYVYGTATSN